MRIAIIGSGALGGFYGGMLARRGYDVHFLFRSDYEAVRRNGLTVQSILGDFHLERVNAYQDPQEIGIVDLALIGLKTTANGWYAELLGPVMGAGSLALTCQNGLGNEERLAELFGAERVGGGLAFLCSNRVGPGVIRHLDYGYLHIGNYQRGPDERLRKFADMLQSAGVEAKVVENLALSRWKKLVWNVPFSGLSALLDQTVDYIMARADLRQRAFRLMKEIQRAAGTHGLTIEDGFLEKMMTDTERMKPYHTSMHLDRIGGRGMEIESILGEPLRRGEAMGAAMPETKRLYEELKTVQEAMVPKPPAGE